MDEIISVIIPTYNRCGYIRKAVESVLKQSYQDIECIVVDDGSDDDTKKVIKAINDNRVRYIGYRNNKGACHARNVGIDNANGEYIAFQDSDDDWVNTKLEEQMQYLKVVGADLVFCQLESRKMDKAAYYPSKKMAEGFVSHKMAMRSFMSSTQTFFGKKDCIKRIKFDENMPRFQDWDFMIRFTAVYKVYYQKKTLAIQILGGDNISSNPNKGYIAICNMIDKYLGEMDRQSLSNLYTLKGTFLVQIGSVNADTEFLRAIKMNPFSRKAFAKLFLSKLGVLGNLYRRVE